MSTIIRFNHFQYEYPDGTTALSDFTFQIPQGQKIGMVGPNGAGKTTALRALSGLIEGDGQIIVHGETLGKNGNKQLRKHVGFVFQNPDNQLFMPTVAEDVAFGPENLNWEKSRVDDAVTNTLMAVDLSGYENRSPHHLSSGEKKRVAIASVLAMQPDTLLLDEPSPNLDPYSRRKLIQLLASLEIPIVIAGHDLELILDLCEHTVILNNGKIVTEGIPHNLFADENLMAENRLEVPYSLRSEIT